MLGSMILFGDQVTLMDSIIHIMDMDTDTHTLIADGDGAWAGDSAGARITATGILLTILTDTEVITARRTIDGMM